MAQNNVVITNLDASIEKSVRDALKGIHEKTYKYAKRVPVGIKQQPTKAWQNKMSENVAYKQVIFELDERLEFTVGYYQKVVEDLLAIEDRNQIQDNELADAMLEIRKAQAYCRHMTKQERQNFASMKQEIENALYEPYSKKDIDYDGYVDAIVDFMQDQFSMTVGRNFAEFIAHNTGSVSTTIRHCNESMISDMKEDAFTTLVLNAMMQIAIDCGNIKDKVVRATVKKVTNFSQVDYDAVLMFEKVENMTKDLMIQRLTEASAQKPVKSAKREAWVKAYKKAKSAGLFIEY